MKKTILEMNNIEKRFSGVHALRNARFDLREGEIHALMGENGAGKSTLMRVLCGIIPRDAGEIIYFGQSVDFPDIAASQAAGISIIHQELNMMNHLSVAQNVFIGREPVRHGFIDDREMELRSRELFSRLGVNVDPHARLGDLTVGKQQMVEIAKAVSHDSRLLVLDEPTAALTEPEVEELFAIMRDLASQGIGMIYISHRMDEIMKIADRVSVMRDGEYVGTLERDECSRDEIVRMMVGRVIYGEKKTVSSVPADAPVVLEVRGLIRKSVIKNVSFSLRRGEILGFAGLMGAGRTEVARAVFGADRRDAGEIFINGKKTQISSPADAVRHGMCYLSEDRKLYGLLLEKSVSENSVLACLGEYVRAGWISESRIRDDASRTNALLHTKTPSMEQPVRFLSGGNQQKVIVARWLLADSDIFIFDEPTRGIDVGAKSEMYALMNDLARDGKSIIMISSELSEIELLCDRIIVMCEGAVTAELGIADATQEKIMHYATLRGEEE